MLIGHVPWFYHRTLESTLVYHGTATVLFCHVPCLHFARISLVIVYQHCQRFHTENLPEDYTLYESMTRATFACV